MVDKYADKLDKAVKKRHKRLSKFIPVFFFVVFCIVLIGFVRSLIGFFVKPTFDAPIPHNWKMQSESGGISSLCFGSWEECGSITREYTTGKEARFSLDEMRLIVESEKWIFTEDLASNRKYNVTRAVIKDDIENWDRTVYVEFTDGHAKVQYIKR